MFCERSVIRLDSHINFYCSNSSISFRASNFKRSFSKDVGPENSRRSFRVSLRPITSSLLIFLFTHKHQRHRRASRNLVWPSNSFCFLPVVNDYIRLCETGLCGLEGNAGSNSFGSPRKGVLSTSKKKKKMQHPLAEVKAVRATEIRMTWLLLTTGKKKWRCMALLQIMRKLVYDLEVTGQFAEMLFLSHHLTKVKNSGSSVLDSGG